MELRTSPRIPGPVMVGLLLAKRALDVIVSLILLVLLAPAIAVVALLVKLDSEGPVLFRQERIGLNKRRFRIYKFRTMVVNAEKMMVELEAMNEVSGPVFKIKNDPRRTRLGGFRCGARASTNCRSC